MKVEMRYNTRYGPDDKRDESRSLRITIEPDSAAERMLFDALREKGVQPKLITQGTSTYPYIEIALDLK